MSGMDDRLAAFEAKFAHDEQLSFKVTARRNKLVALWAAEMMGKPEDALQAYVIEVISSDFEEAGDEDVIRKVSADLEAAGKSVSAADITAKLGELMAVAKTQVMEEVTKKRLLKRCQPHDRGEGTCQIRARAGETGARLLFCRQGACWT